MKRPFAFAAVVLSAFFLLFSPAASCFAAAGGEPLRYYAVDVGQGDCSLFLLPNGQTIVVDAGPAASARETVAYIKSCGVNKIDLLVATHPHEDHIGGMDEVLSSFEIGKVWDSGYNHGSRVQRDFYQKIKDERIPFGRPKRGFTEKFGDVGVEVLAPARLLKNTHSDANNNSIILKITYGDISFLMMADAEREELASIPALPSANILKAGHHGSSNGTDKKLLRHVRPEVIVLSYARGNSYGHPHKEVVNAIRALKILRFDTADGAVKLRTDGVSITYERKRAVR